MIGLEVLTSFFLEAGFLGIMLFGLNRVGPRLHFFATTIGSGTPATTTWPSSTSMNTAPPKPRKPSWERALAHHRRRRFCFPTREFAPRTGNSCLAHIKRKAKGLTLVFWLWRCRSFFIINSLGLFIESFFIQFFTFTLFGS